MRESKEIQGNPTLINGGLRGEKAAGQENPNRPDERPVRRGQPNSVKMQEALVVARDRTVVRRHAVGKIEHRFVDVTPAPSLRRIVALDDRVLGGVIMLGRVTVRRLVATAHMAAGAADPQMHPDVAGLETLLAAEGARRHVANGRRMRAGLRHLGGADRLEVGTWRMRQELMDRGPPLGPFAAPAADPLAPPPP